MDDSTRALARLRTLLEIEEAGALSAEQQAELAEFLRDQPELQEAYVAYRMLDAWLELEYSPPLQPPAESAAEMIAADAASTQNLAAANAPEPVELAPRSRVLSPLLGFLDRLPAAIHPAQHPISFFLTTACITSLFWVLVMVVIQPRNSGEPGGALTQLPPTPQTPFTARMIQLDRVAWADGARAYRAGQFLVPEQELNLASGRLQIQFGNQARVAIEGPAAVRIDSRHGLTLTGGRLLARVPPSGHGFLVQTPVAHVVDLGTEFGLLVQGRETEVQVFTGQVEVFDAEKLQERGRPLASGQAALFGNLPPHGFFVREKKMNRTLFASLVALLSLPIASANVAPAAVIAEWKLDEASGVLVDSAAGGSGAHNVTIGGATYSQPGLYSGTAINFSGANSGASTTNASDLYQQNNSVFTAEGFFNILNASASPQYIMGSRDATNGWNIWVRDSGVLGFLFDGSTGNTSHELATGASSVDDGVNHHFALVFNKTGGTAVGTGKATLYIDYVQNYVMDNIPAAHMDADEGFFLGRRTNGGSPAPFNGVLDNLRFSNQMLTPEQFLGFTAPPAEPAPVPEPTSAALLGLGGMALLNAVRRRRRRS